MKGCEKSLIFRKVAEEETAFFFAQKTAVLLGWQGPTCGKKSATQWRLELSWKKRIIEVAKEVEICKGEILADCGRK